MPHGLGAYAAAETSDGTPRPGGVRGRRGGRGCSKRKRELGKKCSNNAFTGVTVSCTAQFFNLLGQIIIDDERVLSIVPEIFSHGAAGVGGQILEGGGV